MESRIKRTYICKDVHAHQIDANTPVNYQPIVGDVAVFEVMKLGKHKTIQGDNKRNITIATGDLIMAAFGTRYATEQFEGYVPEHINQDLHILGAGGTVGVIASMHSKFIGVGPTILKCRGLVRDHFGKIINTKSISQKKLPVFTGANAAATRVILSVGSSMDSGKTTTAAYLVRGLKNAGYRVAFIKLTGTVYTKDTDLAYDLGADVVSDFGDFGFPSTYMCSEEELLNLYEGTLMNVMLANPDYVIMEIADGLYERETKMLLNCRSFTNTVEAILFSAGDSLAAISGVETLQRWGLFPIGISGLLTTSPLLIREVEENTYVPVYTIEQLGNGAVARSLISAEIIHATN
ncbi:MAG: hypothetical protein ACKVOW_10995 [Chitinophagaceae bacterium]